MSKEIYPNSPFPMTCAALASVGIDPIRVRADNFNFLGYDTFVMDRDGKREWDSSGYVLEHHEWDLPEPKIRMIMDAYIQDHRGGVDR